jgi:hypothetical protein
VDPFTLVVVGGLAALVLVFWVEAGLLRERDEARRRRWPAA